MAQSISKIETGFDKLLCLVNQNNEISLSKASNQLKVSREVIER
jgi:DeoR/GlpR family transcriptional regulator of sugar metabolism